MSERTPTALLQLSSDHGEQCKVIHAILGVRHSTHGLHGRVIVHIIRIERWHLLRTTELTLRAIYTLICNRLRTSAVPIPPSWREVRRLFRVESSRRHWSWKARRWLHRWRMTVDELVAIRIVTSPATCTTAATKKAESIARSPLRRVRWLTICIDCSSTFTFF